MDTFTPAINPSISGTQIAITPRMIISTFGDGYKQSSPDGLNPIALLPTLAWASIDATDGNNVIAFMNAHLGITFYYTLPNETTARKFQWLSGTYGFLSADVLTLSYSLEERFDLTG